MTRSPQRRRFALGAASLGLAAVVPAWLTTAQAQSVDEIKKKGELTVGLLVDFPPYGTVNSSNEPDGYDADVARLLAKDWGVKLKLVPVTGPNRIPFLLTEQGRPADRLAGRHAGARQAGPVLQALCGRDDRAARPARRPTSRGRPTSRA